MCRRVGDIDGVGAGGSQSYLLTLAVVVHDSKVLPTVHHIVCLELYRDWLACLDVHRLGLAVDHRSIVAVDALVELDGDILLVGCRCRVARIDFNAEFVAVDNLLGLVGDVKRLDIACQIAVGHRIDGDCP